MLSDLQALHVELTAELIKYTLAFKGYTLKWGETYRTPEQAQWNAQHGKGIAHSLHMDRLAVDLLLFKDGVYLTDTKDYEFMGVYWESLSPLCVWGGHFSKPDGDHFSITYNGIK